MADSVEQIAENAVNSNSVKYAIDNDVLADPVPIIPKSMQSSFSQVKVSAQNYEKIQENPPKKEAAPAAATNPPDGFAAPEERDEDTEAADQSGMESKIEDDRFKTHAAFVNKKYDIKKVIPGDQIYGHPEFVG